ncbi:MAG TPA: 2'-5' RNA ligase family protein, partial [Candidatus Binatia bacterium]|nr:2'-5' RNA ligase family protein [Candidatus Binatia bacterium]
MRAFLAVPIRPPAHAPVAALIEAFRQQVAGVRWVDTVTTHFTLHFFAELPDDRLRPVVEAVGEAIAGRPAFPVRLGGLGSFPPGRPAGLESPLPARPEDLVGARGRPLPPRVLQPRGGRGGQRPPRVLWLGLAETSLELTATAAAVRAAVAACGFELDHRPFSPHVTLGRPGPRFDGGAWQRMVGTDARIPGFIADQVVLYESRGGHHVREVLPLTGP